MKFLAKLACVVVLVGQLRSLSVNRIHCVDLSRKSMVKEALID